MSTYEAVARREGKFWVVTVEGVGVTQGRSLREAQAMAEDLVEVMTGAAGEVTLTVDLDGGLVQELEAARALQAEAGRVQTAAAQALKNFVKHLHGDCGLSGKDTAFVLGVSEQRVSQLVAVKAGTRQSVAITETSKRGGRVKVARVGQQVSGHGGAPTRKAPVEP